MCYWVNTETGELLSYDEACAQFTEDYDGDDDTNVINFLDVFAPTNIEIVPQITERNLD